MKETRIMKLASLKNGGPDGTLVVVSRDLRRAASATAIAPTMRAALDDWDCAQPALHALYEALNRNDAPAAFDFDAHACIAPLPRTHQFIDASAFLNHGRIMTQAYHPEKKTDASVPILIQRAPTPIIRFPMKPTTAILKVKSAQCSATCRWARRPARRLSRCAFSSSSTT
jgi:hypothetical protein